MAQNYYLALFSDVKISGAHRVYFKLPREVPTVAYLLSDLRAKYAHFYDGLNITENDLQLKVFVRPFHYNRERISQPVPTAQRTTAFQPPEPRRVYQRETE